MDVVVSNDDGILCVEFLFGDEPGDDFRRKKMRSDAKVGLRLLEHADHGLRIEAIECKAATWMLPGLVGAIVEHAHQFGRAADHGDIGFVVGALKEFADVLDGVDVLDCAIAACGESFFKGLRGANVAGPGRSREQEYAEFASHAVRARASEKVEVASST